VCDDAGEPGARPPAGDGRDDHPPGWWVRPGLEPVSGHLIIAGRDAESLARAHGVPLFVNDLTHIEENVRALQGAMARTGLPWKLHWALKAQREPQVLERIRGLGEPGTAEFVGLDVCSPGEVEHGVAHGWPAGEISYTGTNVSDRDLGVILEHGVRVNLDLLSQIRGYGRRDRGDAATGFGIYPERLDEAVEPAGTHDLAIDTMHFHVSHHPLGRCSAHGALHPHQPHQRGSRHLRRGLRAAAAG